MKARKVGGGCDYRGRTFAASALRRFRRAGLLFIVFCSCLLGAGSASAAVGHGFVSSFSTPDFVEPSTVTVDQADGRVFVGDPFAGVVEVFDGSGKLLTQLGGGELEIEALGVAVDEVSGDVYIADRSDEGILVFKPNGASGYSLLSEWTGERLPDKTFGEVTGVAVDNAKSSSAGDVYVLDAEDQSTEQPAVDVFKPRPAGPEEGAEGELVTQIVSGQLEEPNGVAVSKASGAVFVADSAKGAVFKFSTAGLLEAKFNGKGSPQGSFFGPEEEEGNVSAIALDESTGDLLVAEAERHVVSELNAAGEWVGWVTGTPTGAFMEPRGVATGPTGDVYVADALASVVDVFGPGALVPDVVTGKTSKVTRTTATLSGGIDGDGQPAKSHFQWGTSEDELVNSTPVTGSAAGEEKASAVISGLHPDTAYFFRIVGENENGSNVGVIREFETPTAVEGVSTGVVLSLQPEGATLTGSLKPNGLDAHYFFEWGTTTGYGNASPAPPGVDAGSEKAPVTAEAALSGLTPNTVYHYRIVTENELGITHGEDRKFSTSGPPRITIEPVTGLGHNEATVNVKINPGELATSYHIEYGETTAYGHEFPAGGGSIPAGEAPVAVSAAFTGLKIGTTYHYRVVASNSVPPVSMSADQTFTTVPPAPVDASFVSQVSASGATLHAAINPLGHDTHFYFQYGTESCAANPAGCTDVPAPPGTDIGAGEVDVAEEQALTGLSPDTTYFYRAIDSNTLGTTEGPEHTFKTMVEEPTFVLPDGRAWEMVTPPVKNAPVEPLTKEGGMILASENGNQFAYVINGAQGEDVEGNRSPEVGEVLATRSAGAWSSQDIATPSTKAKGVTVGQVPEYQLFTPDLSLALVEPAGKTPAPPLAEGVTQTTMYVRDNATRTYMPVVTNQNTAPGTNFNEQQVHFVNATLDLSHLVLASKVALLGEGSTQGLYEWSAGQLQQVSILPSQLPASGLVEMGYRNTAANAISTDGSRVLWTNVGGSSEERQGALYMRETVHGETVRLDVAQGVAEPSGSPEARFQTASADGSRVFFTDKFKLTPDSTAEPAGQGGQPDLYECEMVEQAGKLACQLSDLTASANPEEHANIKGAVFGIDSDGTALYFVAQNVLAGNENGNHEQAQPGKNNLYAYRLEGGKWNHTFIAMLSSEDSPEWEVNKTANTTFLTARVSPNGRYLAFMSAAPITGYDNTDLHSGKPDEEVFLYDSQAVSLRCVSCNPTGARPTGVFDTLLAGEGLGLLVDRRRVWGEPAHEHWLAGNIPGWTAQSVQSALIQPRYLNDQGRMFFNSPDELVPQAKNGKENVYEYEPSGVGSCQSATGGCVSLISSGTSSEESAFMEATPDGSNVFFITAAALLPQDTDSTFDIYDARVCTAESPCQTPPPPAPEPCGTEEACRLAPPASQAPIAPGGSLTASGANLSPKAPTGSQGVKGSKTTSKSNLPTRQQKLAKALKVCRRQHSKKKRQACENHARKLYGPKHAATKSKAKHASTQTAKRSGR
jgi:hypothetical protein